MTISIDKILENKCVKEYIPFNVQFELTNRCNLACRHCYKIKDGRKELSFKEITNIIDQLVEMGTFYLCFTGGEIFTRSDFFEIAWYAKNKGFFLILLTNGTLIRDKEINELKKLRPLGLEISLLGARAETHDFITQTPGSFERVVNVIDRLVKIGMRVTIKTTLMKKNVTEYKEIKSLSRRLGAHIKIGTNILPKIDGKKDPQQYQIAWEDRLMYLDADDPSNCLMEDMDEHKGLLCKAGKAVASISPFGDIQPCILMPILLGNIRENRFKDIWYNENNDILNQIRAITQEDLKDCFKCELAKYCTRCPGTAYLETHDLFSPSPIACEQARWKAYCNNNILVSPAFHA